MKSSVSFSRCKQLDNNYTDTAKKDSRTKGNLNLHDVIVKYIPNFKGFTFPNSKPQIKSIQYQPNMQLMKQNWFHKYPEGRKIAGEDIIHYKLFPEFNCNANQTHNF